MRRQTLLVLALALGGCRSSSDTGPVDAAVVLPKTRPVLSFSQRVPPTRLPGQPVITDGRERVQGRKLRKDADLACKDDKQCRFSKCSAACAGWMQKAYGPGAPGGPTEKNQIYINCIGACLGPEPDEPK